MAGANRTNTLTDCVKGPGGHVWSTEPKMSPRLQAPYTEPVESGIVSPSSGSGTDCRTDLKKAISTLHLHLPRSPASLSVGRVSFPQDSCPMPYLHGGIPSRNVGYRRRFALSRSRCECLLALLVHCRVDLFSAVSKCTLSLLFLCVLSDSFLRTQEPVKCPRGTPHPVPGLSDNFFPGYFCHNKKLIKNI